MNIQYGNEVMTMDPMTGDISRPAISMLASGQWKVTGAVRLNNFGATVERVSLADIGKIKDWQYKNGKQKWHATDLDHGAPRIWMSPKHKIF